MRKNLHLLTANAAFAGANKRYQVPCVLTRKFRFDASQRLIQLQARAIQKLIGLLERADFEMGETGAPHSNQIQALGGDIEIGVQEERGRIAIDAHVAGNHGEAPDSGILMNDHAAGDKRLILNLYMSGDQGATRDDRVVPDFAVMGNMARGHDVVVIAELGDAFRLGAARDGVMLADFVAIADPQITPLAGEVFV